MSALVQDTEFARSDSIAAVCKLSSGSGVSQLCAEGPCGSVGREGVGPILAQLKTKVLFSSRRCVRLVLRSFQAISLVFPLRPRLLYSLSRASSPPLLARFARHGPLNLGNITCRSRTGPGHYSLCPAGLCPRRLPLLPLPGARGRDRRHLHRPCPGAAGARLEREGPGGSGHQGVRLDRYSMLLSRKR